MINLNNIKSDALKNATCAEFIAEADLIVWERLADPNKPDDFDEIIIADGGDCYAISSELNENGENESMMYSMYEMARIFAESGEDVKNAITDDGREYFANMGIEI